MRNDWRARSHSAYWAFVVHRASGVLLALFLPLVKFAETALVLLLAAHMTGGLRLLAMEFLPWREGHKSLLAVAAGFAVAAGLAFLLNIV
jgi:fumarate reductase subunit D